MFSLFKRLSLRRPLTSYGKVQTLVSNVIRGRSTFIPKERLEQLRLLNVGCGSNARSGFINLDYHWHRGVDICWDITELPLPLKSASLDGIYTEHCLEHVSLLHGERNIAEYFRLLRQGGRVRICVPDGELYMRLYVDRLDGTRDELLPYEKGYLSPLARINGLFRNHGHQFIYDFSTLSILLHRAGFTAIEKQSFGRGSDPALLIDSGWRADESLYVEARKP